MKKRIIVDLIFDFVIACAIMEGLLFGLYFVASSQSVDIALVKSFVEHYWMIALGLGAVIAIYFAICSLICLKRHASVIKSTGLSDAELLSYYKEAEKCCQYRVNGDFIFINTAHGIVCLDRSDIFDHRTKVIHHTRRRRYTSGGYTRRVSHEQDYYTYHFYLATRYGVFKNTVANQTVLSNLKSLFN